MSSDSRSVHHLPVIMVRELSYAILDTTDLDCGDFVKHRMLMMIKGTKQRGCRWCNCVHEGMKSFSLCHEDAQDKDDWIMRIIEATD